MLHWIILVGVLAVLVPGSVAVWRWLAGDPVIQSKAYRSVQRQAKEAEVRANQLALKRGMRHTSHNEWLLMWYNALPEDRKNHFERVWAEKVMDATGSVELYDRQKQGFLLKCASNMVDAVLNPPKEVTKFATAKAVGAMVVGHVRADRIRTTSAVHDNTAVGVSVSAAEARRWKDVRRQWAEKQNWPDPERRRVSAKTPRQACVTCACGPNDAC
jgi:hypothetical protein